MFSRKPPPGFVRATSPKEFANNDIYQRWARRECDEIEELNPLLSSTDGYGKKIRQKPQMNGVSTKLDANKKESNAYIQQNCRGRAYSAFSRVPKGRD
ncbi:hypothetical protein KSC_050550 [Ktedonobacter sp. SOSP1-52]|nr:hypothetical protein KSC_050550 [Ktedonobacter sp. SOSP1-52]